MLRPAVKRYGPKLKTQHHRSHSRDNHSFTIPCEFTRRPMHNCPMEYDFQQLCVAHCHCFGNMRAFSHRRQCMKRKKHPFHITRDLCAEIPRAKAPHNTTQFLINDQMFRYRNCVYSNDFDQSLSAQEEVEKYMLNASLDTLRDKRDNICHTDEDRMPYTFDKMFGLIEFEKLYTDVFL